MRLKIYAQNNTHLIEIYINGVYCGLINSTVCSYTGQTNEDEKQIMIDNGYLWVKGWEVIK